MLRFALISLLLVSALFSAERPQNWNGYLDTVTVPPCSSTVLVYSRAFSLTDFDMVRITLHVDDTTSDGFASDSINLQWGYQTFSQCLNSSGAVDTCYSPRVIIDTANVDTFGTMAVLTLDASGIANTPGQQIDTLGCAGYAVQSRTFSPEWDVYYRIWVQGLTGNLTAAPVKIMFTNLRRLYRGMRGM